MNAPECMNDVDAAASQSPNGVAGDVARRRISPNSLGTKVKRLAWSMVQATLFRLSFHSWSRWRIALLRAFGAEVAWDCTVRRTCRVYYPWLLRMGSLSCLGDGAEVYNLGEIRIGDRVTVSQEAYLCAGTHDHRDPRMPLVTLPIEIGDEAWVCARAFVGPGVKMGAGAIVAACGVVIKDVAPWTIVGGNPARYIKDRPPIAEVGK